VSASESPMPTSRILSRSGSRLKPCRCFRLPIGERQTQDRETTAHFHATGLKPAFSSTATLSNVFSLLVHNQCLISHEDGMALAFKRGHWKNYICALSVDSVTSDAFQQYGLPFAVCSLAHVQLCSCVNGAVTNAALVKDSCC